MPSQSLLALLLFPLVAWLFSEHRSAVKPRMVMVGIALQLGLGALLLGVAPIHEALMQLNGVVEAIQQATAAGSQFLFGYLAGGSAPYEAAHPQNSFIFAIQALPIILLMSVLSALLFHWGILQRVVWLFSWLLERSMKVSGALGLSAAANVFVGMVEAPLLVRPYLERMSRAELFALMSCGMATVAGTVLVFYASVIGPVLPGALGHLLTASVISVPAALTMGLIMVPEQDGAMALKVELPRAESQTVMDAIVRGTRSGTELLIQIAAMLLVLVALVKLANITLGMLPTVLNDPITLERMLGWVMAPVVWLMGIPWSEATTAGALMGTKTVLNELIAYLHMAQLPVDALSERSRMIMTYALCGFANLGSLGIMVGGFTAMLPSRRDEILSLAPKTLLSGTLATLMTGAIAGLFYAG
uniref:Putative Na+(H+)/nucleoside cotransporter n=1 Tax=Magnetococcus massalia (strain MO-1) TaxID=451514 RepID=A0A1S7LH32_MAGMO|nr:putative Na+(H+)/nucleoside cotransporter [Candidatus Magnetococcus massalia]